MYRHIVSRVIAVVGLGFLASCSSYHNHINPMQQKIPPSNLIHGYMATEYRQNEMIGAGIGALGNSTVMEYQDRLESELRKKISSSGITLSREGHVLRLALPAGMSFDGNSAELNPTLYSSLNTLAKVLDDYRQTMIEIIGYADARSSDNPRLPEQRAFEISSYLIEQQLRHERFEVVGIRRAVPAQVEIRLLPLQRTASRLPRAGQMQLVNTKGFVAL